MENQGNTPGTGQEPHGFLKHMAGLLEEHGRLLVGGTKGVTILPLLAPQSSLVAQTVKHLPTMRETRVQSLGWEDLLEKEMATHSSILAWKIPWMEGPGGLQSMGSQRVGHD